MAAAYDGVSKSTFDASLASLAVRGTWRCSGRPVGRCRRWIPNGSPAAGSVYLTRPSLVHFIRSTDEFAWRAGELIDAIATGAITITVGGHYPLAEVQRHEDLQGRRPRGRSSWCPDLGVLLGSDAGPGVA